MDNRTACRPVIKLLQLVERIKSILSLAETKNFTGDNDYNNRNIKAPLFYIIRGFSFLKKLWNWGILFPYHAGIVHR